MTYHEWCSAWDQWVPGNDFDIGAMQMAFAESDGVAPSDYWIVEIHSRGASALLEWSREVKATRE